MCYHGVEMLGLTIEKRLSARLCVIEVEKRETGMSAQGCVQSKHL